MKSISEQLLTLDKGKKDSIETLKDKGIILDKDTNLYTVLRAIDIYYKSKAWNDSELAWVYSNFPLDNNDIGKLTTQYNINTPSPGGGSYHFSLDDWTPYDKTSSVLDRLNVKKSWKDNVINSFKLNESRNVVLSNYTYPTWILLNTELAKEKTYRIPELIYPKTLKHKNTPQDVSFVTSRHTKLTINDTVTDITDNVRPTISIQTPEKAQGDQITVKYETKWGKLINEYLINIDRYLMLDLNYDINLGHNKYNTTYNVAQHGTSLNSDNMSDIYKNRTIWTFDKPVNHVNSISSAYISTIFPKSEMDKIISSTDIYQIKNYEGTLEINGKTIKDQQSEERTWYIMGIYPVKENDELDYDNPINEQLIAPNYYVKSLTYLTSYVSVLNDGYTFDWCKYPLFKTDRTYFKYWNITNTSPTTELVDENSILDTVGVHRYKNVSTTYSSLQTGLNANLDPLSAIDSEKPTFTADTFLYGRKTQNKVTMDGSPTLDTIVRMPRKKFAIQIFKGSPRVDPSIFMPEITAIFNNGRDNHMSVGNNVNYDLTSLYTGTALGSYNKRVQMQFHNIDNWKIPQPLFNNFNFFDLFDLEATSPKIIDTRNIDKKDSIFLRDTFDLDFCMAHSGSIYLEGPSLVQAVNENTIPEIPGLLSKQDRRTLGLPEASLYDQLNEEGFILFEIPEKNQEDTFAFLKNCQVRILSFKYDNGVNKWIRYLISTKINDDMIFKYKNKLYLKLKIDPFFVGIDRSNIRTINENIMNGTVSPGERDVLVFFTQQNDYLYNDNEFNPEFSTYDGNLELIKSDDGIALYKYRSGGLMDMDRILTQDQEFNIEKDILVNTRKDMLFERSSNTTNNQDIKTEIARPVLGGSVNGYVISIPSEKFIFRNSFLYSPVHATIFKKISFYDIRLFFRDEFSNTILRKDIARKKYPIMTNMLTDYSIYDINSPEFDKNAAFSLWLEYYLFVKFFNKYEVDEISGSDMGDEISGGVMGAYYSAREIDIASETPKWRNCLTNEFSSLNLNLSKLTDDVVNRIISAFVNTQADGKKFDMVLKFNDWEGLYSGFKTPELLKPYMENITNNKLEELIIWLSAMNSNTMVDYSEYQNSGYFTIINKDFPMSNKFNEKQNLYGIAQPYIEGKSPESYKSNMIYIETMLKDWNNVTADTMITKYKINEFNNLKKTIILRIDMCRSSDIPHNDFEGMSVEDWTQPFNKNGKQGTEFQNYHDSEPPSVQTLFGVFGTIEQFIRKSLNVRYVEFGLGIDGTGLNSDGLLVSYTNALHYNINSYNFNSIPHTKIIVPGPMTYEDRIGPKTDVYFSDLTNHKDFKMKYHAWATGDGTGINPMMDPYTRNKKIELKTSTNGGHIPSNIILNDMTDTEFGKLIRNIKSSHLTYIVDHNYDNNYTSEKYEEIKKWIGHRMNIQSYTISTELWSGDASVHQVTVHNAGNAPYTWCVNEKNEYKVLNFNLRLRNKYDPDVWVQHDQFSNETISEFRTMPGQSKQITLDTSILQRVGYGGNKGNFTQITEPAWDFKYDSEIKIDLLLSFKHPTSTIHSGVYLNIWHNPNNEENFVINLK